jgi:hypothetical protein
MENRTLRVIKLTRFRKIENDWNDLSENHNALSWCEAELLKEVDRLDLWVVDGFIITRGFEGDDFMHNKVTIRIRANCIKLPK